MIVLDTNVLAEFMVSSPDVRVMRWLDRLPGSSIWTTSICVYEIRAGLLAMAAGGRRDALETHFNQILQTEIRNRILGFDTEAAERAAALSADRRKRGRPRDIRDTMIAGIVLATGATLATRNVRHFEEIAARVVNPWEA